MDEEQLFRAGYIELEYELKNKQIEYHYIEVWLKNPDDIFKLRKAQGLTIKEVRERIQTRADLKEELISESF